MNGLVRPIDLTARAPRATAEFELLCCTTLEHKYPLQKDHTRGQRAALHNVDRQAEGAGHERPFSETLSVHVTDVRLLAGAVGVVERCAYALAVEDIAFTVGDEVVDKALGGCAKRVGAVARRGRRDDSHFTCVGEYAAAAVMSTG